MLKKNMIICLVCATFLFAACDKKEAEDLKKNDKEQIENNDKNKDDNKDNDSETKPTVTYTPVSCNTVAIEFTGQFCSACPYELKKLRGHKDSFKEKFMFVAMHPSMRGSQHLYSKTASTYFEYLINLDVFRAEFPNTVYNTLGSYADKRSVYDMVHKTKPALAFHTKITHKNKTISAEFSAVACKGQENKTAGRPLSVLMWITQSNVIAPQYIGGWDKNYEHTNVMRGSLNGDWGEDYKLGDTYKIENKNIPDKVFFEDKDGREVALVVVIIDKTTKQVFAAAEYPISNWEE